MGQSVWLFLYFICRADSKTGQTKQPTKYSEISERMGVSVSAIRRWKDALVKHGYIEVERHAHGFSVQIQNWKPSKKGAGTEGANEGRVPESEHSQGERVFKSNTKSAPIWTFTPKKLNENGNNYNELETRDNSLKEVREVLLSRKENFSFMKGTPDGETAAVENGDDHVWFS